MKQQLSHNTDEYKKFIVHIKKRILSSQYEALKAVNKELIELYWDIGKMVHENKKSTLGGSQL